MTPFVIVLLFGITAAVTYLLTRKAEASPPPDPQPDPTPEPKPDPQPDPTPSKIPWLTLRGMNYRNTSILARKQNAPLETAIDKTHCDQQIAASKQMGVNLWRVVCNWEAAVDLDGKSIRPLFLAMLDYVCKTCQANGIWVWPDFNHHFFCSSHISKRGDGFPKFIIQKIYTGLPLLPGPDDDATSPAREFWELYYQNKIPGINVWDEQVKYMRAIVATVDKYSNVIGYEILNEPHFYKSPTTDVSWYHKQCGNMQTYVGNKLQTSEGTYKGTDKYIIFTRETMHGGGSWEPGSRHFMTPKLTRLKDKVWWTPHHYAPPNSVKGKENLNQYRDTWDDMQKAPYNIVNPPPMAWGECGTQSNQYCPVDPVTKKIKEGPGECPALQDPIQGQKNMTDFVKSAKANGVIPVYWQSGSGAGLGNRLTDAATGKLTEFGERYKNAIKEVYG